MSDKFNSFFHTKNGKYEFSYGLLNLLNYTE